MTEEVSTTKGTTQFQYDTNGSLTSKVNTQTGEANSYTYNLNNRLATATITRMEDTKLVDITSNYVYNQSGIRVVANTSTKIDGGAAEVKNKVYLTAPANFTGYAQVVEEKVNGTLAKSYTLGDDVLAQTAGGTTSYLQYDGHGSTRLLTSASSAIASRFNYDAYGKNLFSANVTSPSATDMLYSGEQFDPNLQMQYLRARYYDQNSGRFNRVDPFSGNNDDPQSLHKYAYAHCEPVLMIDPSGLMSLVSVQGAMTIIMSVVSEYVYVAGEALEAIKARFGENEALRIALTAVRIYQYIEIAMFLIFAVVLVAKIALNIPKIFKFFWNILKKIPDFIQELKKLSSLSWKWKNVRARLLRQGWVLPNQPVHHKYIPQGGTGELSIKGFFKEQWGRFVPNFIKNQKWNLMPVENRTIHNALHGKGSQAFWIGKRLWHGSGPVFKAGVVGLSVATAWIIDKFVND